MAVEMTMRRAQTLLGVDENATTREINRAFRQVALLTHPDHNRELNADEIFREIRSAYDLLLFLRQDGNNNDNEREALRQLPPNEFDLELTLEEILHGGFKEMTITRKVLNEITGDVEDEEVVLQVPFRPGVLATTRITMRREGDRHEGQIPANAVFIVREQRHPHFKRLRTDLEYTAELTTDEACFRRAWVPTLENDLVRLDFDEVITPITERVIEGQGLPHLSNGRRGDIKVKFEIFFDSDEPQDPPREYDLPLSLKQIIDGYTKIIKINRQCMGQNGETWMEDKFLFINARPGTPENTRFRFHRKGNKLNPNVLPSDIIFITKYEPHPFTQNGVNLEYTIEITSSEARNKNISFEVPKPDGTKFRNIIDEPITTDTVKIFPGYGLPHFDEPENRGDLILKFRIIKDKRVDPQIVRSLELTLENILRGCQKQLKIVRKIFDKNGKESTEEKIIEIDIQPGTEVGTRFRFFRLANQYPNSIAGDMVFVTRDKQNDTFKRNGTNLECVAKYSQSDFGKNVLIPTLDKGFKPFSLDNLINPKIATVTLPGYGLPYPNEPEKRGNLKVKFEKVQFQQDLPVERLLYLTAKEIQQGITKKIKFVRKIFDNDGTELNQSKKHILEIKPGTKFETQKIFYQAGDESPGKLPPDVIYVIKEKIKSPPIEYELFVTLEEVLTGSSKIFEFTRSITNSTNPDEKTIEKKTFNVHIKPGTETNSKIVFPNEGDRTPDKIPADIVLVIRNKPHKLFQRNGADIKYFSKIATESPVFGVRINIPNLSNEIIEVNMDEITSETVHRIASQGLPYPDNPTKRGDLVVHFEFCQEEEEEFINEVNSLFIE